MLKKMGLLSIPLNFIFAGLGMLMLLKVDGASGNYFQKISSEKEAWINAHIILLISTFFLISSSVTIRFYTNKLTILSNSLLLIIIPTAIKIRLKIINLRCIRYERKSNHPINLRCSSV